MEIWEGDWNKERQRYKKFIMFVLIAGTFDRHQRNL